MSMRTIIEINHDYVHDIDDHPEKFVSLIATALKQGSSEYWTDLSRFGVTYGLIVHHSEDRAAKSKHLTYDFRKGTKYPNPEIALQKVLARIADGKGDASAIARKALGRNTLTNNPSVIPPLPGGWQPIEQLVPLNGMRVDLWVEGTGDGHRVADSVFDGLWLDRDDFPVQGSITHFRYPDRPDEGPISSTLEEIERYLASWDTSQSIRLHIGEVKTSEMRLAKAIVTSFADSIRDIMKKMNQKGRR